MKILSKVFLLPVIVVISTATTLFADTQCYCDNNDQPIWGEAVIDGNISEWNLSATYFDVLWKYGVNQKRWKNYSEGSQSAYKSW